MIEPTPPSSLRRWVVGARLRTLPAAIVPVVVGTATAGARTPVIWWRAGAALAVALALQVATNLANDYSDGIRGTDAPGVRTGPTRLVGSGLVEAATVKWAAFGAFGVAGLFGAALAAAVGPELLVVGAASMAAGWLYTGGPRPYGYAGLGEVFVFVFFGIVATVGSDYVQAEALDGRAFAAAFPVGLLAVSLLMANNLRDIASDGPAGKRTLAVRVGDCASRNAYTAVVLVALVGAVAMGLAYPWAVLAGLGLPLVVAAVRPVRAGATGADLIPVLAATGRLQLVVGLLLGLGIALS